jgi:hypothetical protein
MGQELIRDPTVLFSLIYLGFRILWESSCQDTPQLSRGSLFLVLSLIDLFYCTPLGKKAYRHCEQYETKTHGGLLTVTANRYEHRYLRVRVLHHLRSPLCIPTAQRDT